VLLQLTARNDFIQSKNSQQILKRCDEIVAKGVAAVTAKILRILTTLGFILLGLSVMGCERSTSVRLEGGTAPVFVLSGSGAVAIFTVFDSDYMIKAKKPGDEDFALWKIEPSKGYLRGTWIRDLGSITYGVVPPGYVQVKPAVGTPLPLVEGQKYFYFVETTAAPGAGGYLEIKNSRSVPTTGSGPCFLRENSKWILVRCYDAKP